MIVQIPSDGKFYQTNDSEISGNIWASWNLDLESNPGRIRISPQTRMRLSNADSSLFIYPFAFASGNFDGIKTRIWATCNGVVYKTSNEIDGSGDIPDVSSWEYDTTLNSPSDLDYLISDVAEMNGTMFVSTSTDIKALISGTWNTSFWQGTLGQASLFGGSNNPKALCRSFNNLLLIGSGNTVASVDISGTVDLTAMALPRAYRIIWIRSSNSIIWVGCRNIDGGKTKIFAWDGYSENFNYDYEITGSYSLAGVIKDEIPYTINERGEFLVFNGGGFIQLTKFPSFNSDYNFSDDNIYLASITRNSMIVHDNLIHILVNASVNDVLLENQLSGVWVYDPKIGLHHKYSITKAASGITDYGSPAIIRPGCLYSLPKNNGNLLIGCSSYISDLQGTASIRHAILDIKNNETDTSDKIGYFITSKIQTSQVEEQWQKIYVLIKKLLNSTDKIYVKYRTDWQDFGELGAGQNIYAQKATWADTNTIYFNSSDSTSYISVGDEVEILAGEGAGLSANVESTDGTLFVLDETVASASGTITARISNWKKVGTDINTQGLRNFELPIDARSTWIQFKIVCMWKGKNEIEKLNPSAS